MSPTTQHGNPLPDYSASAPPPGYSAQVTDGEELLAATHTPLSSRRTGSYSRSWDHGIGIRVVLHELNEDVGSQMPVYHQRGLICGTIYQENPRNTLQVFLKIEGKLKLSVFGNNPHTSTIKVVDECYELWSKSRSQAGTSTIPNEIAFSSVLPTTFRDGDRDVSVPPSHEISLPGLPGLYSQCTYAVKILLVTRSPLWNKTKTFTIPFKYRPRSRPPVPLLTHDGIRPGCPIFHATIKRAPEVWFETLSILRCKPASGLAPVEVQLFMPSGRTFGLADEIPFHIQLTGTASSIQTLYRLLSPLSASSEFRALTPTLTNQSTRDSINSKYSVKENDDRNFVFFSVTLIRQVCVEVKDQAVWKSFSIGKGIIHPIPPPFELAVLADDAFLPPHSADHTEKIVNLDAAGEIQCQPDVDIGHFNGGKVQVKDFLVLQIAPFKKSDNARSPFFPLKMPVPVFIVTDSWSEHPMVV
ncbi:hypothetical protein F5879DRAFT_997125 [Lentinula edodes]|uniref:uncharacterized protein n=1 Tax=Lentinula edodes TaxID=5353 RepID=UPI001E8D00FE|nr:uncharacterized protein C8R40DRAFT_880144 [Lentinula edodes]KAH7877993.1 hypothetical protein C8R40DRAFT_880144 [Lentinula edodes]KAJ3910529.1 hypothetical protein F5879DRAFT_997125 [Lentinula edodes]